MNAPHRTAVAIALFCAALLSGCASPDMTGTSVILLPQPDGRPSAVVVKAKGGERVIDQPFERVSTTEAGSTSGLRIDRTDLTRLQADHPALFKLVPLTAERFELFFEAGGTVLTAASLRALEQGLKTADAFAGSDLVVIGYTDTVGTPQMNDALSLRRAIQVQQLLVKRGFPVERIEAVGRGMRELAIPTADGVDEPRNRRVAVIIR